MKCFSLMAALLLFVNSSWGAGYQLRYQGAESMGTAFASAGSYGESLSSIYYNPGLFLMQNKKRAFSGELMALHPTDSEFTSASGTKYDDFTSTGLSGGFFYGYRVDDTTALTVALTTPWGTQSDYDSDWEGRYHAVKTKLAAVNLQTMLSKRFSDKFTASIGPQVQHLSGELSTAVPTAFPNAAASDLLADLNADNISVGGVLALTYMPSKKTSFGFNYTSRIKHNLRGDFKSTPTNPTLQNSKNANAEITTPDVFTLGVTQSLSEKLLGHFSLSYTNWSLFKELTLRAANVIGGVGTFESTVPQNWEDTYFIALGTTYNMKEHLTLRYGVSYETGAVENADRTPRSQDADRIGLGFGASFPIKNVKLDIGLNHIIYTGDIELDIADVSPATVPTLPAGRDGVSGSYDNAATLLRVGVEYIF